MSKPPSPPVITLEGTVRSGPGLWRFLHRNRHWTLPPALIPLFAVAGFVLAERRQHEGTIIAAVVAAGFTWFFAPHKWTDDKGKPRAGEVWYARLSVLAAGAWLSVASWTGLGLITGCVMAGLVLVWGIFWFIHKRPRSKPGDRASVEEWNAWWQHHNRDWNLLGSAVAETSSKGNMDTLVIQLWRGRQTRRTVEDAVPLIESALGDYVRPGGVRADAHPHDSSKALVRIKREDPLAVAASWHPGMAISSITEPAPVGFTESAETMLQVLLANWFIIGASRTGKSNELSEFLASITGCPDARVWLVDMKGGRAARPWMPAVDWCAVSMDEAAIMFTTARDEIKARATHADDTQEQLRPTREVPAIFLVIDETYEVTSVDAGNSRLAALLAVIASQGMGVAVYTVVLTQYGALDESVRTEQTRSNLPNRICFRVARSEHGAFALSDYSRLDASRLKEQGSFYIQLGPEAASAPGRGHKMSHELVRQVATRHGAMPRPKLVLFASQHQETYDSRWSRLPKPFWRSAPQCDGLDPAAAPELDRSPVADAIEVTSQAMAARIETEIAHLPDTPPLPVRDGAVRAVMNDNRKRFADALAAAGPEGIEPKDLITACGLSRGWVMGKLRDLHEAGVVAKIPLAGARNRHGYRADSANEVLAAIEDARRRDDALLSV
jgi:hypothetical protein